MTVRGWGREKDNFAHVRGRKGGDDNETTRDLLPEDASSQLRCPRENKSGGGGGGGAFCKRGKKATTFIPSSSQKHTRKKPFTVVFFPLLFLRLPRRGVCRPVCRWSASANKSHTYPRAVCAAISSSSNVSAICFNQTGWGGGERVVSIGKRFSREKRLRPFLFFCRCQERRVGGEEKRAASCLLCVESARVQGGAFTDGNETRRTFSAMYATRASPMSTDDYTEDPWRYSRNQHPALLLSNAARSTSTEASVFSSQKCDAFLPHFYTHTHTATVKLMRPVFHFPSPVRRSR